MFKSLKVFVEKWDIFDKRSTFIWNTVFVFAVAFHLFDASLLNKIIHLFF